MLVHSFNIKGINGLISKVLSRVNGQSREGAEEGEKLGACFQKGDGAPHSAHVVERLGVQGEKRVAPLRASHSSPVELESP